MYDRLTSQIHTGSFEPGDQPNVLGGGSPWPAPFTSSHLVLHTHPAPDTTIPFDFLSSHTIHALTRSLCCDEAPTAYHLTAEPPVSTNDLAWDFACLVQLVER